MPRVRDEVVAKSYACMRPRRRRLLKRILSVPNCGSDRIVSITLHIFHPICLYLCILVSQADITGHLFAARFFSLSFHVSHATEKHDVFDQNPFDSLFDICMRRSAYKWCCSFSWTSFDTYFVCSGFQIFSASPTAGPSTGATIVTLYGEYLSDATGCKFGNSIVAVNSYAGLGMQASSIICTAPSQGSAASVTSISAVIDGDISTNFLSWTYYGQ